MGGNLTTRAQELLAELSRRGVILGAKGEQLRYRPKDGVTPELRETIALHKAALVALVHAPQGEGEPTPITQAPTRCPGPGQALWAGDPEVQELIAWFRQEPFKTPPPWRLGPGRVIQDRWRFLFDLWADIQAGPEGPGANSGALREELSQLRELFDPQRCLYPCGRCGRPVRAVPDPGWPDHLRVDCPHGGYVLRGDVDLRPEGLEKPPSSPECWSLLADSGWHPDQVRDLFEGLFLFALSLLNDPTRAREDCRTLPLMWAYYSPFWRERLPREAFEELSAKIPPALPGASGFPRRPGLQEAPRPLRPLVLRRDGAGCAQCASPEYWVSAKGVRYCLACHPAPYKDAITISRIKPAEEEASRPSNRRRGKKLDPPPSGERPLVAYGRPFWQRKDGSCFVCGSRRSWVSAHGVAVCALCHPPSSLGLVSRWIEAPAAGAGEENRVKESGEP